MKVIEDWSKAPNENVMFKELIIEESIRSVVIFTPIVRTAYGSPSHSGKLNLFAK